MPPPYCLSFSKTAQIFRKGLNFTTSKDVLQAVLDKEVRGALLEINEAAALADFISGNGLLVKKKIDSTKGVGFVLSGGMKGLHSEIRGYVKSNQDILDTLLKNVTKPLDVSLTSRFLSGDAQFIR